MNNGVSDIGASYLLVIPDSETEVKPSIGGDCMINELACHMSASTLEAGSDTGQGIPVPVVGGMESVCGGRGVEWTISPNNTVIIL